MLCLLQLVALQIASHTRSAPYRFDAMVGCCVILLRQPPAVNQFQLMDMMMCAPLLIFPRQLLRCSSPQRSASANELIVMFLRCCCAAGNCMHLGAHHLCTSRQELHQLVHSHQTISVVLMAKSAASRRSPTTVEASEGVGWLGRWFGGGAEAAGHGFDG